MIGGLQLFGARIWELVQSVLYLCLHSYAIGFTIALSTMAQFAVFGPNLVVLTAMTYGWAVELNHILINSMAVHAAPALVWQ